MLFYYLLNIILLFIEYYFIIYFTLSYFSLGGSVYGFTEGLCRCFIRSTGPREETY